MLILGRDRRLNQLGSNQGANGHMSDRPV